MKKAYLNLRGYVPERARIFTAGLERLGFKVLPYVTFKPDESDILVTWNRIADGDQAANAFESMGLPVLVTENALWGNSFAGDNWYALGRSYHNTIGCAPYHGPTRWESLGVKLDPVEPPRLGKTLILMQRGIGPPETRQPLHFRETIKERFPKADIREHPGTRKDVAPLSSVLDDYHTVATWASAGGVLASMHGKHVFSHLKNWIGYVPPYDVNERTLMLRRLAWATARWSEIESGEAFERLLA
jgi:hypothetical protein